MRKTRWVLAAAVAMLGWTGAAQAQDCECDCYFSFDCNGGFCDYGSSFTIEDECWWRTPKPEGSPGTGCGDHYGDWGQCDGKCSGTAEAQGVVGTSLGR